LEFNFAEWKATVRKFIAMLLRKFGSLIFFVSFVSLAWWYNYPTELTMRPHSVHRWRQCDGAQIAINYYNVSMNFFEPRLSICNGNDGKMVSEFPVIYYTAACLYKIFGPHEYFLRLISLTIFFAGLYFLYKTISLLLDDELYALVFSLMLFTSAVVIDYAFNFLPDVPALSFTFIGYYFFLSFIKYGESKHLFYAATFFAFAGTLKITSLLGYFAIAAMLVTIIIAGKETTITKKFAASKITCCVFFILPVITAAAWIAYVKYYNNTNSNFYFTTSLRPIWEGDFYQVRDVFRRLDWQWLRAYMYRDFLHTLPFVFVLCFLIAVKKNIALKWWLFYSLVFCTLYFFSFFLQFFHHDYYVVCMMFLPIAVCVVLMKQVKERFPKMFHSPATKSALVILLIVMAYHGHRINMEREAEVNTENFHEYWNIEPQLEMAGISKTDKIISIGDETSGVSLYFMNRRGWTQLMIPNPVPVKYIEECRSKGAKYLMVYKNCEANLDSITAAKYKTHTAAIINGIKIYRL
jgi:hypothetical protein